MNGRRTPDANYNLKGALLNLNLGSDPPIILKSLVEATCFGARKIIDRFIDEGVQINRILAFGGISRKLPYVMQTLCDVIQLPIKVSASNQTCALGSAMFASVAAKIHLDIPNAMNKMGSGFDVTYQPNT
jgi:L-ribulokinase|tara:strand:+ start:137 stop:526 length:390 start_codon:yes stop_codon:yes gene_type:complete